MLWRIRSRRQRARERLETRVATLFEALGEAAEVADRLRVDTSLSDLEREAALQVLLQLTVEGED